jgi:hypothetical protein
MQFPAWSSIPAGIKNSHFSISLRKAVGPIQPPIEWVLGAPSSEVKQQEREADHSHPTRAEFKKIWIYTSIPAIHLHDIALN